MTPVLPSFRFPPVTEVIIAARFKPADRYLLTRLGRFATTLETRGFVREEQRPGFDAPIERFGRVGAPDVAFELVMGPPPIRHWFMNEGGDELLQVQANWFACNWRKVAPEAAYGRWDSRWDAFETWITEFEKVVASESLRYDQVEVTYVNHIDQAGIWESHGEGHRVFRFLSEPSMDERGHLSNREQVAAELRYVIRDPVQDEPVGRLNVSMAPAFRAPRQTPIFVFTLTARGFPLGSGLEGVRKFAELAHERIVTGFTELTAPAMHDIWQREVMTKGEPAREDS